MNMKQAIEQAKNNTKQDGCMLNLYFCKPSQTPPITNAKTITATEASSEIVAATDSAHETAADTDGQPGRTH